MQVLTNEIHLWLQWLTFRVQGACGCEDLLGDEGHKVVNVVMVTVVRVTIVMVVVHCVSVNADTTIGAGGEEKRLSGGKQVLIPHIT